MAESSLPNNISNTAFGTGESARGDGSLQESIGASETQGNVSSESNKGIHPAQRNSTEGTDRKPDERPSIESARDTTHRDISPSTKTSNAIKNTENDEIETAPKQEILAGSDRDFNAAIRDQPAPAPTLPVEETSVSLPERSGTGIDDGADFHKRPSATHNPIIKVRDKFFPAGAGPAVDAAPPFEQDTNFHPTPSKTHNPIIAVRDKLFPAGKGAAADTHEFEGDPNFHKKASESHNPIIAVRDKLFPAGSSNPNDEHATTHPRASDTTGHHSFPGFDSPAQPESDIERKGSSNVIIEPHTGLPMDLNRGTGKFGIDGNAHNPGYIGGGHQPPNPKDLLQEKRKSSVIEPHTGLPMDSSKGSGSGGIDGNTHNPGYTGGGVEPADPRIEIDERRKSTVVEPHTGLPMDIRKGSGAGGIDGNAHTAGYQAET